MATPSNRPGGGLAVASSVLFVLSGLLALATAAQVLTDFGRTSVEARAGLPATFYAAWVCATLGVVGAVVTLFVVGYRAPWFWWFLLVGALLWIGFPPLGTAVGLVAFVLLLATRRQFAAPRPATP